MKLRLKKALFATYINQEIHNIFINMFPYRNLFIFIVLMMLFSIIRAFYTLCNK